MLKIIILFLFLNCVTINVIERPIKNEVAEINVREDGFCNYTVKPSSNYIIKIRDICGKYKIGDSLIRIERYSIYK